MNKTFCIYIFFNVLQQLETEMSSYERSCMHAIWDSKITKDVKYNLNQQQCQAFWPQIYIFISLTPSGRFKAVRFTSTLQRCKFLLTNCGRKCQSEMCLRFCPKGQQEWSLSVGFIKYTSGNALKLNLVSKSSF